MTEGIKGTQFRSPAPTLQTDKAKLEQVSGEADSPSTQDAAVLNEVAARSVDEVRQEVDAATEAVRKIEVGVESLRQAPREAPRANGSDGAPPEPRREAREVDSASSEGSVGAVEVEASEPPIRTPDEATRVAERVSRDIVANPSQALAVNVNVAAVRALFN